MQTALYLDAAASARPLDEVVAQAGQISLKDFANPASIHGFGEACNRLVEDARHTILETLVGDAARDFECIFTSGATEGNNLAILGAAHANANYARRVVTSTAEHNAVSKVCDLLESEGYEIVRVPIGLDGQPDPVAFEAALAKPACLFTFIAVSNQNGAVLPIERMVQRVRQAQPRAVFHTDAAQALGKVRLDWSACDLVTFSGHKIGGLKGSGALIKRKKCRLLPPEVGGGQENGLRSGTLNTPGDVTLATAVAHAYRTLDERTARANLFKKTLLEDLEGLDEVVNLSPKGCTPFVIALGLKTRRASTVVQYLSSKGIYISTTSACDVKKNEPNHILRSMGVPAHEADNPLRLSLMGEREGEAEAHAFASALKAAIAALRPER